MRLSEFEVDAIKQVVHRIAGPAAQVRLFGSRTDDQARGGDIDLLLEMSVPAERPALLGAQVAAGIERLIGERRIDVLVRGTESARTAHPPRCARAEPAAVKVDRETPEAQRLA